jgi:uncharacterized protein
MRALLDVNVLLALLDQAHVQHATAREWMHSHIQHGWASCPLTQNGFVRIISHPNYPRGITSAAAISLLRGAVSAEMHEFWPADISLLNEETVEPSRVLGPRQITDLYLLALAVRNSGRFVTFDRGISIAAVRAASQDNLVVL